MNKKNKIITTTLALSALVLVITLSGKKHHHAPHEVSLKANKVNRVLAKRKSLFKTVMKATKTYLFGAYDTSWERGFKLTKEQKREQRHLFGYHLRIEHIKDTNPVIKTTPNHPTLYFHGWGDQKNSAMLF